MKTADREYIKEAVRRKEWSQEDADRMIRDLESATDKHGNFKQCCAPGWDDPVKIIATDHT